MTNSSPLVTAPHRAQGEPWYAPMAGAQFLADALPYFGLLIVFLVLPVALLLLRAVSWSAVFALVLMDLSVIVCVTLEDRYEQQLIKPS